MACKHLEHIHNEVPAAGQAYAGGCEECVKLGQRWVHLRECLVCGHTGCCDSSPGKHATGHFKATEHPVMRSVEPGEHWRWCFIDEEMAER